MWIKKKSLYDKLNKDWIQSQVALRTLEWKVSQMFIHVYTHLSFKTLNRKFFLCIASSSIQIDAQHTWHCQKPLCVSLLIHIFIQVSVFCKRGQKRIKATLLLMNLLWDVVDARWYKKQDRWLFTWRFLDFVCTSLENIMKLCKFSNCLVRSTDIYYLIILLVSLCGLIICIPRIYRHKTII